jgi:hypothetical protein
MDTWMERVSNLSADELKTKLAGEWVDVPGYTRRHLASDLLIVKEFRNRAATEPLVSGHDDRRSNAPIEKLFERSLFAELDYDRIREHDIILGSNLRIKIGDAGPDEWRLYDDVERVNYEAQREAHNKKVSARRQRQTLFRRHPDCKTFDQLVIKLGWWIPPRSDGEAAA